MTVCVQRSEVTDRSDESLILTEPEATGDGLKPHSLGKSVASASLVDDLDEYNT